MAVPTYDKLIFPLLQVLSNYPQGMKSHEAHEEVADWIRLSPKDRRELTPSGGQAVYRNRVGWAHDRLKRSGLSHSLQRGLWQLTPAGFAFYQENQKGLDEQQVKEFRNLESSVSESKHRSEVENPSMGIVSSPEEQIDQSIVELNRSLSQELLESIGFCRPLFFERLVLDVLVAMGYGVSRSEMQQTGGSGDGGIDGIINLDRLGLEKVYVQAKRWKGNIGRPDIQSFFGALAGRRAKKGVFITTSSFTKEAREYAEQVSDSLVLVDGNLLTDLMIEYGVGVQVHRIVRVGRMDRDYFEDL